MLQSVENKSAVTSERGSHELVVDNKHEVSALEDEIFLIIDKLQALCAAQSQLNGNDYELTPSNRAHLSMIVEDHVKELRSLLETQFA